MNLYEYPVWAGMWSAIGLIGCGLIRVIYGIWLVHLALRKGQPLTVTFGGFRLGEAAVTQKAVPRSENETVRLTDSHQGGELLPHVLSSEGGINER